MNELGYVIIEADSIFSPSMDFRGKRHLLIRNGIIETISEPSPISHRTQYFDFTGFSISPLFCDYHLHFSGSALSISQKIENDLLKNGIHKVFEGGDNHLSGMKMKKLIEDSLEVRTAGCAIYKKNTYGKFIGKGVDSLCEARGLIDYLTEEGVDYIKVINSGIFRAETAGITSGGFRQNELKEIVGYARGRGLPVFCHANGGRQIHEAVSAGVSCIVHGLFITDEALDLMAGKGTAFIPTVNAFAALNRLNNVRDTLTNIENAVNGHLSAVRKAVERGVKVLAGSDSGPHFIPYGTAFHEELSLFKRAGLSDEQILLSAVDAQFMPGMPANFLVLNGVEIEKVFIRGTCIKELDSHP